MSREDLPPDLRAAIQEGIDSGPGIPSEDLFAELDDRYAEIGGKPSGKPAT